MEDEGSLELSLGLFCGASSSNKSKVNAPDPKIASGVTKESLVGSLNVADSSLGLLYSSNIDKNVLGGQQRHEGFWRNMGQTVPVADEDGPRFRQMWGIDERGSVADDNLVQNKRKMPFEDVIILKRTEMGKEGDESTRSLNDGGVKSHISVNSEDGSSAENEAVAESETEASNSWYISQAKGSGNDSETGNFSSNQLSRGSNILPQGKGSANVSMHQPNNALGSLPYGVLPSLQSGTGAAILMKSPNAASATAIAGNHLSSGMQRGSVSGATEHTISHAVKSNSLHLSSFGYQSAQLPTLETSSSWLFGPHLDRKSGVDAQPNSSHSQDRTNAVQAVSFDGRTMDPLKGSGKCIHEVGTPSASLEEETDGNRQGVRPRLTPAQVEGFPTEGSIIRPGIAPGLKFGGCGSYPDLPWVSTTGSGPNGKTISGVTYKFSKNQIKIVCACHGMHMSPEEFIQHADAGSSNSDSNNVGLSSLRNGNPSASAQS